MGKFGKVEFHALLVVFAAHPQRPAAAFCLVSGTFKETHERFGGNQPGIVACHCGTFKTAVKYQIAVIGVCGKIRGAGEFFDPDLFDPCKPEGERKSGCALRNLHTEKEILSARFSREDLRGKIAQFRQQFAVLVKVDDPGGNLMPGRGAQFKDLKRDTHIKCLSGFGERQSVKIDLHTAVRRKALNKKGILLNHSPGLSSENPEIRFGPLGIAEITVRKNIGAVKRSKKRQHCKTQDLFHFTSPGLKQISSNCQVNILPASGIFKLSNNGKKRKKSMFSAVVPSCRKFPDFITLLKHLRDICENLPFLILYFWNLGARGAIL